LTSRCAPNVLLRPVIQRYDWLTSRCTPNVLLRAVIQCYDWLTTHCCTAGVLVRV